MDKIIMTAEEKDLLTNDSLINREIQVQGRAYILKNYLAQGMKSVVWKGIEDFSDANVAIKFATKRDYEENPYIAEVKKMAPLYSHEQFAKYQGAQELTIEGVECVVFIEDYIPGIPLKNFTKITPTFIESYVNQFCIILNILKENKLRHDDLNLGNVMIVPPQKGDYRNEYRIKVIDMGSLKDYDTTLKESKLGFDDLRRFCVHLQYLANGLLTQTKIIRKPLTRKEKAFRQVIRKVLPLILEEDKNISLHDPEKIRDVFSTEFANCQKKSGMVLNKIETPFDYISADHIGSDRLLDELFATSCPWLSEVKNNTPILLTGPRGCGKSMIFRWLSFKSILAQGDKNRIENTSIIGFYVSCSADLRNRFSLYDSLLKTSQAKEEIIHYFNLLLTREMVFTLSLMCQMEETVEIFGLSTSAENDIYNYIIKQLNLEESKMYLQGSKPFDHLYDVIMREMNDCYRHMLRRTKVTNPTSLSYLSDLTFLLKSKISFFSTRTITFLLDDYSLHRINEPVQVTLNPILWERQSNHIFKVSSEKFGMVTMADNTSENYSSTSDLTREYREIDVGERYINLSDQNNSISQLTAFCTELLNHRLKLAEYRGTANDLIGNSNYGEYSTLERTLRQQSSQQKKDYDEYHGIETISKICSGDISALLETYRRVFKEGNVTNESVKSISKHAQNKAIQSTSRAFLEIIKTFNHGPDMYDLVNSFGNLSRKILQFGKLQKDGSPQVTTRIEVDELEDVSAWKKEQKNLFYELLQRSIFISLEQGRGRRTLGTTLRIQLRRIYCPHFKTGLTKTVAIKLTSAEFKMFLADAKGFCDGEYAKRWSMPDNNQSQLNF